jgi:hypothetical protein
MEMTSTSDRTQTWIKARPVQCALPKAEITAIQERAAVSVGEPGAMALFGFATGTWIVRTVVPGIFAPAAYAAAAPVLIVFAGLAQFIGGLMPSGGATRSLVSHSVPTVRTTWWSASSSCYMRSSSCRSPATLRCSRASRFSRSGYFYRYGTGGDATQPRGRQCARATRRRLRPGGSSRCECGYQWRTQQVAYIGGYLLIASAGVAYYTAAPLVLNTAHGRGVLSLFGDA